MIPKGLIIAVSVGIISAAVLGLFVTTMSVTSQIQAGEGPSVSVVLGQSDFKLGEEIQFEILNSGTEVLTFSDTSYGVKITTLTGRLMFSPLASPLITSLDPNESVMFEWDQAKNDGEAVLEGTYKIVVEGFDKHNNKVKDSVTINILK